MVLPRGNPAGETHAYSLEEIAQMFKVLPEPASTIAAVAAFTGIRKGELRGLLWENYDGEQVLISQSFWRGHALEPKTRQSKAPVPVIAQLARLLDSHRCSSGNPANGLMFVSPVGKPVNLDALAADIIVPLVTQAGVRWRGWHAFRRGLATNLHQLGVPDKTIQKNLAALQRGSHAELLHQDRGLRSSGGNAAIWAISRICTSGMLRAST